MTPLSSFPDAAAASTRRAWLKRFLAASMTLVAAPPGQAAFEWKIVTRDGRDHVTLRDIQRFYSFPRLQRDGRNAWLKSATMVVKISVNAEDIYINNVKFCLCFPTYEQGGDILISRMDLAKLLDPIIRPTKIGNTVNFDTVVLDAGHGGHDSGAVGRFGAEKVYTLDTVFRLQKALQAQGLKTLLTRSTDVFLSLGERVAIANRTSRSIFVSVHFNSYSSSAIGLETFALAPQGTANSYDDLKNSDFRNRRGNARDSENIALATAVHANALYKLRSVDRGVKRDRFSVISGIEKPGILVEGGFVSNALEGARIHRPEFRQSLADAIAGGIRNYRSAILRRNAASGTGTTLSG
ncbi:MAG: n-acetylmuramoyl-l-alanine amidase [Verrucomicrobiales bacterium]|nr:n-acetylmuramoyl-l-alanine amidase [Verrucomicrobiales bacterium]